MNKDDFKIAFVLGMITGILVIGILLISVFSSSANFYKSEAVKRGYGIYVPDGSNSPKFQWVEPKK